MTSYPCDRCGEWQELEFLYSVWEGDVKRLLCAECRGRDEQ